MRPFIENFPYGSNRGSITPPPSDYIDARVLAANTAERHTIPAGAGAVSFSSTGDFYVKFGDNTVTASVPSGDVTNGTASELNPTARRWPSGITHISIVAPATTTVTLSFWS